MGKELFTSPNSKDKNQKFSKIATTFSTGLFLNAFDLLSKVQNVEVSDTRDDAQEATARNKKIRNLQIRNRNILIPPNS